MHMVTMFLNVYMNRMCCLASCEISLHISTKTAQNLIFDGCLQNFPLNYMKPYDGWIDGMRLPVHFHLN